MSVIKPINSNMNIGNFSNDSVIKEERSPVESQHEMFEIVQENSHSNSQPALRQGGGQCGDC